MLLMKYFIDVGDELFKANNNCLWLFYNVIVLLHTLLKFEIAFEMKWFRFAETLQCHGYDNAILTKYFYKDIFWLWH